MNEYDIKQKDREFKFADRLRVNYRDMKKFMKYKGFEEYRHASCTHVIYKHKKTGKTVPVPSKKGTLPQGTVSNILKQINSNRKELAKFLYK